MKPNASPIPYGLADFVRVRTDESYYVDKTPFIPRLERVGSFLGFLRPRRFGKSLLVSMLECYYDRNRRGQFERLFEGTWIYDHPTPEQGQYLVLRLDFSMVFAQSDRVEASFDGQCSIVLDSFLHRYADCLPEERVAEIRRQPNFNLRFSHLLQVMADERLPFYLFIDEYDHFANNLLATEGRESYQRLTHGGGFFRHFFTLLKGATGQSGSGLKRLYLTGVSPLVLDDVTSGFNILRNLTLEPAFAGMAGFTEDETRNLIDHFAAISQRPGAPDSVALWPLLTQWYNGYRFNPKSTETVFNSDMVLYFALTLYERGEPPDELIDINVRTDYSKLRYLVQMGQSLNGNFARLKAVLEEGEAHGPIIGSFPVARLTEPQHFISLLYHLGLLTHGGMKEGRVRLTVPNETIWQLHYSYLRDAYWEVNVFTPALWTLQDHLAALAYRGEWTGFFDYLAQQVAEQTSVRDYLQGEKVIQGFLLAYLNVLPFYLTRSEREAGRGFPDLFLEPFLMKHPDLRHSYLIELKYLRRGEDTPERRAALIADGAAQLRRYLADVDLRRRVGSTQLHGLLLVYHGWELVERREVE